MTIHPPLPIFTVAVISYLLSCCFSHAAPAPTFVTGSQGAVATVNRIASEAGISALKKGGNAIDAAVAAGLVLGVVDGHNSGIGGGCFILIRTGAGDFLAIDGRETAPRKASAKMFFRDGQADPALSQTGPLAAGVPGALAAYEHAVKNYGKLSFKSHLLAAAEIAEEGFVIDSHYASRLQATAKELKLFEPTRKIFLQSNGEPLSRGARLKQPDLAGTYRNIARAGTHWFYRGSFARETERWMKKNGGVMEATDFARYKIRNREPLRTTYRDYEIIGFPPPSSGGVHVAQILNILEPHDLKKLDAASPEYVHLVAEAMKLAFADRALWLGDPDYSKVPRGLLAKDYARHLSGKIRLDQASEVPSAGQPPDAARDYFGRHTTHFSAADNQGNWVACTATLNTSFGSKVVIPGTGVVLNNQMDDFSVEPGKPNYFGLVGAEANAVAPGKRPLSSMSPTFLLRDGKPVMALGAAGGPTIISQTVLNILNVVEFGDDFSVALSRPRFHHQWKPDEIKIEAELHQKVGAALKSKGHKVDSTGFIGASQIVGMKEGKLIGVSDPRVGGQAAAW